MFQRDEPCEENTGDPVAESMGDCAYGDGATRQAFLDAGRILIAKVPGRPNKAYFPKEDFQIDLEAGTCTCPAGQVSLVKLRLKSHPDGQGGWQRPWGFVFDKLLCGACALRSQCVAGKKGKGRTVSLHPQEALMQQARAFQHSPAFAEYRRRRQVVEHRWARLVQLGIRQARYFGRVKTRFQLLMAVTVANLTLIAVKMGMMKTAGGRTLSEFFSRVNTLIASLKAFILWLTLFTPDGYYKSILTECFHKGAFRPDF